MIRGASPSVYVSGLGRVGPRVADPPAVFLRFLGPRRLGAASMDPLAVAALASAIQNHEGYYPGSVAYINNNPGNLMYAGQAGATPGPGGFAVFSSYTAGYQALQNQIVLDATRGTDANGNPVATVGDLVSSWAPANAPGNSPQTVNAYISSVTSQTGYDASDNLLSLGAGYASTDAAAGDSASVDDGSLSPAWWLAAAAGLVVVLSLR